MRRCSSWSTSVLLVAVYGASFACSNQGTNPTREQVLEAKGHGGERMEALGEANVAEALREYAKAGPGTLSRAHCQRGQPNFRSSRGEITLTCGGPKGSETVTVVRCSSREVRTVMFRDSIGVFCPEE